MSKEYDETKAKPAISTSREPKEIDGSKVQNILSKRKYDINFDDKKYAIKTIKTQFLKTEQQPSKLRDFLKLVPIVGGFLAGFFAPEKEVYKKSHLQTGYSSEARGDTRINNKHTEEVGSKLKKSSVEQVDDEKSRGL